MSGLYVHVPFCKRKCNYCGFYSIKLDKDDVELFLKAVRREAEIKRKNYPLPSSFKTVYIGGGTPSALSYDLVKLIDFLTGYFSIDSDAEFTVELNPESVTRDLLRDLLSCGVNRLSFGVQTLSDRDLILLGRLHSSKDALLALELAFSLGFTNVSVDLIYGYPTHDITTWSMTLRGILNFPIKHISCYEFELERGSYIERLVSEGKLMLISEEASLALMDLMDDILNRFNFHQYEISNFSKPGYECRHNINYWLNGDYVGLGPSAATHLGGIREKNISDLRKYLDGIETDEIAIEYREELNEDMKFRESIILALRTIEGVNVNSFLQRYGKNPINFYEADLKNLGQEGLIEFDEQGFRLTKRGLRLANYVMQKFI